MMCYNCSPVEQRDKQAKMIWSKPPDIPTQLAPTPTPVPQVGPTHEDYVSLRIMIHQLQKKESQ
jgi:hypothetical protein